MSTPIRVLFVGDIVGKPGRRIFKELVNVLSERYDVDLTIANVENAADGFGITKKIYNELDPYVDIMTGGNHTWDKEEIIDDILNLSKLLRPINLSPLAPGRGFAVLNVNGVDVLVANAIGRIFMNPSDNPFFALEELLSIFPSVKVKIVDFHAEATSEKQAFGWYFDGQVSAILGSHTHVQTADERILPEGTAYISDVGMTGCHDGVLGFGYQEALDRFLKSIPKRLKACKTNLRLDACVVEIDPKSGKAEDIIRISEPYYLNKK